MTLTPQSLECKLLWYMVDMSRPTGQFVSGKKRLESYLTEMTKNDRPCWAGNRYFAKKLGCGVRQIQRYISALVKDKKYTVKIKRYWQADIDGTYGWTSVRNIRRVKSGSVRFSMGTRKQYFKTMGREKVRKDRESYTSEDNDYVVEIPSRNRNLSKWHNRAKPPDKEIEISETWVKPKYHLDAEGKETTGKDEVDFSSFDAMVALNKKIKEENEAKRRLPLSEDEKKEAEHIDHFAALNSLYNGKN